MPWHHMPAQDVLFAVESAPYGLSVQEAKERQLIQSKKGLLKQDRPTSWTRIFFRQLTSPFVAVLAIAAALSTFLGKWEDAALTLGIVLLQAALGFAQEYKADRALYALRSLLPQKARVRRGGRVLEVPAAEVVAGDIVLLTAGDRVLADGRILQAQDFSTNESPLTGESGEVQKTARPVELETTVAERLSMVFAGSTVMSGKAEIVVTAVGTETEFGKVTTMVRSTAQQDTPLQHELKRLSRLLVFMMLTAAGVVFVLGALRGLSLVDMLATSTALAVAAIPESLLVSLTVILAVGTRRMLKRRALTRRLVAAETLGSVNVMCIDKTGTLTTGEMTVTEIRVGLRLVDAARPDEVTRMFLRDLWRSLDTASTSATERALVTFLTKQQANSSLDQASLLAEIPFRSSRKYAVRLVASPEGKKCLVLGAPDVVLAKCDLSDHELQAYRRVHEDMTKRGLRVVFLAQKMGLEELPADGSLPADLQPSGFIGLQDPVRLHAADTLKEAARAGVRTIMVTGDHPTTAQLVARSLSLRAEADQILTGQEIAHLSDDALALRLQTASVCARVLPEQKVRIVRALQSMGNAVAMTGDGVNDAPALRAADIGVAVGSGTDVAKETADMVILDNDVRSLVAAIREGRVIFDNLRKVLAYLLTFSLSEVILLAAVIALGLPLPFAPLHILWINLLTDGLPSIALAWEPQEPGVMREPPRRRNEPVINASMRQLMLFAGAVAVGGLLLLYVALLETGATVEYARTMLFVALGIDSLIVVYALRLLRKPFWQSRPWSNPWLSLAVLMGLAFLTVPQLFPALRAVFGFVLLPVEAWALLFGVVVVKLFVIEVGKVWFLGPIRRRQRLLLS